jgi:hypothetical protein
MTNTRPDPIPHLISAVTELSFALRDLDASRPVPATHAPVAQDGLEHVDELTELLDLIEKKLRAQRSQP